MTVYIETPRNLNREQKEALRKFSDTLGESNYEQRKSFFGKIQAMRNGHFITDYHCHSTVSPDGHNTMREMAEAAVRLGVDDLCFTDHIEPLPWDRWNEPPKEKHSYDWAPMLAQFREAQEAVGDRIKLHMGAELGECSFAPDVADSFLDDAPPLDFTIGSVHCYRTASGEVNDLTWIDEHRSRGVVRRLRELL